MKRSNPFSWLVWNFREISKSFTAWRVCDGRPRNPLRQASMCTHQHTAASGKCTNFVLKSHRRISGWVSRWHPSSCLAGGEGLEMSAYHFEKKQISSSIPRLCISCMILSSLTKLWLDFGLRQARAAIFSGKWTTSLLICSTHSLSIL